MARRRQSPIDIPATAPVRHEGLELEYHATPVVLGANPTAVQVDCAPGSGVAIRGTRYELVQFHIHCPAEHTIDRVRTPMELHLVHRSARGRIAVIAVMYAEGAPNASLGHVVAALTGEIVPGELDLAELLPTERGHVAYEGSLTTPPYDEGVDWRVLTQRQELSAAQLHALQAIHYRNNRPIQPLNERLFD